jgi:probable HAF family extracellular repeat protein
MASFRWYRSPCRAIAAIVAVVSLLALAASGASARRPSEDVAGNAPTVRSPGFVLANGGYRTIEVPGSRTHTYAHGINRRGQIAGGFDNPSFDGPDGRGHGAIRQTNGRFLQFDVPGALATVANKINDRGQIVGGSNDTGVSVGAPGTKGFLWYRGRLTRLKVPGSIETQAVGINNHGRVVGEYIDAAGTYHGFLWHKGRFTTIDGPRAIGAAVTDINDRGQMVGAYIDADGSHRGFLLSKGRDRTFAAPYGPLTLPSDINNRGQIVGITFSDLVGGDAHGYLLAAGVKGPFTPIDVPGALGTLPRGIDDRGRIVGLYESPNPTPASARASARRPVPISVLRADLGG